MSVAGICFLRCGCGDAAYHHRRIRYASAEKAQFGQQEVGAGILPGGGGSERLPRLVGRIMLVDFAITAERDEHLSPEAAVRKASLLRFRPIMKTTAAALLGGMPLMLGFGTGAEIRQPLNYAMVGGLLVNQALTLFTTPVIYVISTYSRRAYGRRSVGAILVGRVKGPRPRDRFISKLAQIVYDDRHRILELPGSALDAEG